MGTLSAKMTLKDGYGFGGFSLAPPSKQHLSTPPPPPRINGHTFAGASTGAASSLAMTSEYLGQLLW